MEKTFVTLVKRSCELPGAYEHMLGVVEGIHLTTCELPYGLMESPAQVTEYGTFLTACCEEEAYKDFKAIVEWLYPGKCEFYYGLN